VQQFPPDGISLRWYAAALDRPEFRDSALRSLILAIVASAISVLLGTLSAVALTRYEFKYKRAIEIALLSPLLVPQVVVGMSFLVLMVQLGIASLTMLAVLHVILTLPFSVRVTTAALLKANLAVEFAARSLGANPVRAFVLVTLPLIRPGMIAAAIFSFVTSFENFTASQFLIWRQTTLPVELYHYMRTESDPTVAALSAILMLSVATVVIAVSWIWRLDAVKLTGGR
jgi:putative spermidine/putrescine transport system permease protein